MGKALAFYASQRIKMNRLKIKAEDPIKEEDGVKISCIIHKNRFAGKHNPFTKCNYYATYEGGIDTLICLPDMLVDAGILRKAGAWLYYEDENGNPLTVAGTECKFGSKGAFINETRSNEEFAKIFIDMLGPLSQSQTKEEVDAAQKELDKISEEMSEIAREGEISDINEMLDENSEECV